MQDSEDRTTPPTVGAPIAPAARPSADVDGVLEDLESLDDLDVGEHVAVYGRMHTALTDALARTADSGPEPER